MEKNGTFSLFETSINGKRDVCIHSDVSLYQRIEAVMKVLCEGKVPPDLSFASVINLLLLNSEDQVFKYLSRFLPNKPHRIIYIKTGKFWEQVS